MANTKYSSARVSNEKELIKAINNNTTFIYVEGQLKVDFDKIVKERKQKSTAGNLAIVGLNLIELFNPITGPFAIIGGIFAWKTIAGSVSNHKLKQYEVTKTETELYLRKKEK